ncbi:hypothetical protein [Magnetospirillum sp. UT-4]|uniref:hypothetical protein n=1 Tax=Magnetospirillum sp. UT-4 TaxID=2681467 RepID=UPI0015739F04|nr:hypothetical protein [Magnetospirillum sp. UT-4]
MTAAATARPASGGRNVASVNVGALEEAGFSPQIGINDNRLFRYDEERSFDFSERREPEQKATPFIIRATNGFRVDEVDDGQSASSGGGAFLDMVMRGVGTYENNMRITTPGTVRPGSVLNYLY